MQKLSFPQKKTAEQAWQEASKFFSEKKVQEGLQAFQEAIHLNPHYEEAFCGAIHKLIEFNHLHIADNIVQTAYTRFPQSLKIKYICAHFYDKVKNMENVLKILQEAWHLSGENFEITSQLVGSSESLCEWGFLQEITKKLHNEYQKGNFYQTREFPLFHVAWCDDVSINQKVIAKHALDFSGHIQPLPLKKINNKARIRVGYISSDWYDHATLILMQGMFKHHNRDHFEIYIYDHSPVRSNPNRIMLKQNIDAWHHLHHLSDEEAAKKIREDDIDILIEVKAWTQGNRTPILAYKPAPIQVSFLALPATTGAPFIDYIIGDPTVTPKEHDKYYTEKVIRLPDTYQPNDCDRSICMNGKTREDFGLKDDQFVFCSFNQPFKIDPTIFFAWMEILKRVPNSVLWLLTPPDAKAKENIKKWAKWIYNIDEDRLIFSDRLVNNEHLERLKLVDIALDTRIYTGHTTTTDALWSNIPVVTIEGKHFASRVASGLLKALGIEETITHSIDEFVEKACYLAEHPEKLKALKLKIENHRLLFPLFDTERYMRHFEIALKTIYESHCNEEVPVSFDVPALPQRLTSFKSDPLHESHVSLFNLLPSLEKVLGGIDHFPKKIKIQNKTSSPLFLLGRKKPLECNEIITFDDICDVYVNPKDVTYIRPYLEDQLFELYRKHPQTLPELKEFSFTPLLSHEKLKDPALHIFHAKKSFQSDLQTEKFLKFLIESVAKEEKIDPIAWFEKRQESFERFLTEPKSVKRNTIPPLVHRVWINLPNQFGEIPDLNPLLSSVKGNYTHYLWVYNTALCPKTVEILEKAGYEIKLFPRDLPQASVDLFQKELFQEKNIGTAVDILKAEILYHIGGVYLDVDVEICDELATWCEKADFLTTVSPSLLVHTGFFLASRPSHPVMETLRNLIQRNFSSKKPSYFQGPYSLRDPRIGTTFLTESLPLSIACGKSMDTQHDVVLPPYLFHKMEPSFYPLGIHMRHELWLQAQNKK